jgi:hypothetical protein
MVRHLTLWHTLQWVAVVLASSPPSASRSMARKFSSLVIFGDSYTDQGVHQYRPASDGTVGVPVRDTHSLKRNFLWLYVSIA